MFLKEIFKYFHYFFFIKKGRKECDNFPHIIRNNLINTHTHTNTPESNVEFQKEPHMNAISGKFE